MYILINIYIFRKPFQSHPIASLLNKTHIAPEYVDYQFQCYPLDVAVEALLPCSFLCPLLIDVSAGCNAALIQFKMYMQRLAPATNTLDTEINSGDISISIA